MYLPASARREADETAPADAGGNLVPQCLKCSKKHGQRWGVEGHYGLKDRGHTLGGEPYTDIIANCHGEEQIVRIEGMEWQPETKSPEEEAARVAAIAAIVFFTDSADGVTIPARVYRAFINEKMFGRRAVGRGGLS